MKKKLTGAVILASMAAPASAADEVPILDICDPATVSQLKAKLVEDGFVAPPDQCLDIHVRFLEIYDEEDAPLVGTVDPVLQVSDPGLVANLKALLLAEGYVGPEQEHLHLAFCSMWIYDEEDFPVCGGTPPITQ